ncbi:hypothetical protein ACHAWO_001481 [Cyclotella atomus]|uniref:Uncharacterized protein n=1 Tax=Cyclotella atomus TaxID=382360 RepID=A0ABD3QUW3_9STRA
MLATFDSCSSSKNFYESPHFWSRSEFELLAWRIVIVIACTGLPWNVPHKPAREIFRRSHCYVIGPQGSISFLIFSWSTGWYCFMKTFS